METRIILNRIKCPDGTILTSHYRHDFQEYTDENGIYSMADGVCEYLRRGGKFEDLSVYSDAPFEEIRKAFHRGGRGANNNLPLTWVPMNEMSNSWLEACIVYNEERGQKGCFANSMYQKELDYRVINNINISDEEE